MRVALSELYSAALSLPVGSPSRRPLPEPQVPAGWRGFDGFESYSEVFDPQGPAEIVVASLTDDILDIHRDLKRGLARIAAGEAERAAVWEWRFSFDAHWGHHAVGALGALHAACGHLDAVHAGSQSSGRSRRAR